MKGREQNIPGDPSHRCRLHNKVLESDKNSVCSSDSEDDPAIDDDKGGILGTDGYLEHKP